MRGKLWPVCVMAIALGALSLPAAAGADVLDAYQRLAARKLNPAPLIPTAVPPSDSGPLTLTLDHHAL